MVKKETIETAKPTSSTGSIKNRGEIPSAFMERNSKSLTNRPIPMSVPIKAAKGAAFAITAGSEYSISNATSLKGACFERTSSANNRILLTKKIKNKNKKQTKKYSSISFTIYKKSSFCFMPIIFYTINHRYINSRDAGRTVPVRTPSGF